eukprot:7160553-Prymnesium_polylepis.1
MASFVRSAPPRRADCRVVVGGCCAVRRVEGVQAAAAALYRQEGAGDGASSRLPVRPHANAAALSPAAPVGGAAAPAPRGTPDASSPSPSAAPSRARQRSARGAQPAVRAHTQPQTHPPAPAADADAAAPAARVARQE